MLLKYEGAKHDMNLAEANHIVLFFLTISCHPSGYGSRGLVSELVILVSKTCEVILIQVHHLILLQRIYVSSPASVNGNSQLAVF
jgi:hypothetical protein